MSRVAKVRVALDMSTFRDSVCPLVVTRAPDQTQLSTRFEVWRRSSMATVVT